MSGSGIWLVVIFIGEGILFFPSGDLVVDVEWGFWALLRDILFWVLGRMAALDGGLVCEGVEVIDEAGAGFWACSRMAGLCRLPFCAGSAGSG